MHGTPASHHRSSQYAATHASTHSPSGPTVWRAHRLTARANVASTASRRKAPASAPSSTELCVWARAGEKEKMMRLMRCVWLGVAVLSLLSQQLEANHCPPTHAPAEQRQLRESGRGETLHPAACPSRSPRSPAALPLLRTAAAAAAAAAEAQGVQRLFQLLFLFVCLFDRSQTHEDVSEHTQQSITHHH